MTFPYLVLGRHGQSHANHTLQESPCGLYYSLCGSDRTVPLTQLGQRQADRLGELLARVFHGPRRLHRVFDNSYFRVQHTTDRVLRKLRYPVLRETLDCLEKRSYGKFWNLTRRGVEELYPSEWLEYQRLGDLLYRAPEGGENYPDVFARSDRFVEECIEENSENTAVITSSVMILAIRRRLEGISDEEVLRAYEEQSVPNGGAIFYRREANRWVRCNADLNVA